MTFLRPPCSTPRLVTSQAGRGIPLTAAIPGMGDLLQPVSIGLLGLILWRVRNLECVMGNGNSGGVQGRLRAVESATAAHRAACDVRHAGIERRLEELSS